MPVGLLIAKAYGFEIYQFRPTDPCCRGRYDVNAKVPQGATTEQFHQMMRNLLKDRFQLKLHHEKKNMTVYELTVVVGGPKLKEAATTSASGSQDPWALAEYTMGKDGYPIFPAGRGGLAGPNGHYRWRLSGESAPQGSLRTGSSGSPTACARPLQKAALGSPAFQDLWTRPAKRIANAPKPPASKSSVPGSGTAVALNVPTTPVGSGRVPSGLGISSKVVELASAAA